VDAVGAHAKGGKGGLGGFDFWRSWYILKEKEQDSMKKGLVTRLSPGLWPGRWGRPPAGV
jgi:hypothetical protein